MNHNVEIINEDHVAKNVAIQPIWLYPREKMRGICKFI